MAGFFLFAFIATSLLVIPIGFTLNYHESTSTLNAVKRETSALSALLSNSISHNNLKQAIRLSDSYAHSTGRQVLVLDGSGVLVASKSSQGDDSALLKIAASVGPRELSGVTPSTGNEGPQYYVAMSLPHAASPSQSIDHVVLVVTYPVGTVSKTIRSDWRNLILYGLLMLLMAGVFGLLISNSLVKPLRRIGEAVQEIGAGQLDVRAPVPEGPLELQRLAESINATANRLISLLEAQRAFVEDASHQLRTPLTALQLHIENLQGDSTNPDVHDYSAVLSEVGRLNRLVDSLLALARNESRSPILRAVNLYDVVIERVNVWRPLAEEMNLDLEISVPLSLVVLVVEGILEQVLDNLLSNAFDATPNGGEIMVRASQSGDAIELHVIDNGSGLTADERELALRRFWRGRDNPSDGSGLGLAIVNQLVRLSGGSMELRESPSGGIDAAVRLKSS